MEYYASCEEGSTVPKRGLPDTQRCVTTRTSSKSWRRPAGRHIGSMIPLDMIEPNADQPRRTSATSKSWPPPSARRGCSSRSSSAARPNRYQIISGERRFRAASWRDLTRCPAIELDVDDKESIEIALIENIQRKDLTPSKSRKRSEALPRSSATPTKIWPSAWVSHEPRLPRRCRSTRSRPRFAKSAAWQASRTDRCCCRWCVRVMRRRCWPWSRRSPARVPRANNSARKPKNRKPPGRPEVICLCLQTANQSLQPQVAVQQAQRHEGRSNLGRSKKSSRISSRPNRRPFYGVHD